MTESLTFSNPVVENQDIIFYNFVGNFIPPEWRNLTNNCGKQLSKTSRQLLSLLFYFRSQELIKMLKIENWR